MIAAPSHQMLKTTHDHRRIPRIPDCGNPAPRLFCSLNRPLVGRKRELGPGPRPRRLSGFQRRHGRPCLPSSQRRRGHQRRLLVRSRRPNLQPPSPRRRMVSTRRRLALEPTFQSPSAALTETAIGITPSTLVSVSSCSTRGLTPAATMRMPRFLHRTWCVTSIPSPIESI